MALLVADCPRCGSAEMTFDVNAQAHVGTRSSWVHLFEVFAICRRCERPTIFLLALKDISVRDEVLRTDALVKLNHALNQIFAVERPITIRDTASHEPPEFLPKQIEDAFREGATCFAIGCNNAAATMFRLCVDLVTRPLLPEPSDTDRVL